MSSTRDLVLDTLLSKQRVTVVELANAVNINPISVRHHISKLEADGLVESETERHGVGRPRSVFFLSEKGRELFPARMIRLTSNLISQLKETLPEGSLDKIFREMGNKIQNGEKGKVSKMTLEQRLAWIDERLTSEGFGISIEQTADEIHIHETSCPYFHIGREHSEICTIDQEVINSALETESTRTSCLLHGDSKCTYVIPIEDIPAFMPQTSN